MTLSPMPPSEFLAALVYLGILLTISIYVPVKMVANPPGGDRKLADRLREKAIDLILEGLGKPASAEK